MHLLDVSHPIRIAFLVKGVELLMFTDMHLVFLILIVTTGCFLVPRFRSDLVALASLLALYLTGLLSVEETFSGFANSVVIMIAALFVVGEGVFQTGLAERAGSTLVKYTGKNEFRLTVLMMLLVAVLSGFMSNTGTVAILLPVIVSLCKQMHIHPGKLLMPLAFTSSMGGTLTLIGTAPNLIASQRLVDYGYEGLSFFSFTLIGSIVLVVGIIYLWFIGRRMLDKPLKTSNDGKELVSTDLLKEYNIDHCINSIEVPAASDVVGRTLKELCWASLYDVTVLEVIKTKPRRRFPFSVGTMPRRFSVGADYSLDAEDRLIVYSEKQGLNKLAKETGVGVADSKTLAGLRLQEAQLAEVILTPQSQLINQTIREAHFRDKYDLTILALKHQYKDARRPTQDDKLLYGDTMLVHGKWKDINLLHQERDDAVVLSHVEEPPVTPEHSVRSIIAGAILVLMVFLMILELVPAVISVVIAAMLMVLTRCVRHADHAYRSVNWHTIVLIACMLPMATALEKTGGIEFISEGLVQTLGGLGPIAVMAGLYGITSIFSQFISNTATAVLLYPVAILTAQQLGVNPTPMVMAVAFSASMAFATPVATPPNAMVMAAGRYSFLDFLRVGMPIQILIAVCILLLLPLFLGF